MAAPPICHDSDLATWRAAHSSCPDQTWWEHAAQSIANHTGHMTYVNVGANKGYNLAAMAARYGAQVDGRSWYAALLEHMRDRGQPFDVVKAERSRKGSGGTLCGVCRACVEGPSSFPTTRQSLQMFAIELLPANVAWLRAAMDRFGLNVPVLQLAAGNVSGDELYVPSEVAVGAESIKATHGQNQSTVVSVKTVALDDFFRSQKIHHAHLVSIDTEGSDGAVLLGMRQHLAQGKVDALEFEYSARWKETNSDVTLSSTLAWLEGLDYACWWQGEDGCLSPASTACWRQEFSAVTWGNIVCVRRGARSMFAAVSGLAEVCSTRREGIQRFARLSRRWELIMKHDRELVATALQIANTTHAPGPARWGRDRSWLTARHEMQ